MQAGEQVVVQSSAVDPDRGPKALRYSVSYAALGGSPSQPGWLGLDATHGAAHRHRAAGAAGTPVVGHDRGHRRTAVGHAELHACGARAPALQPRSRGRRPELRGRGELRRGATVGQVKGSDSDGDKLTWALTTTGAPFAIDAASGTLTTTQALDHETEDSYTLTVRASDGTRLHRRRR